MSNDMQTIAMIVIGIHMAFFMIQFKQ